MKREQIPFHIVRSIYLVSRIRHEKSLTYAEFAECVRNVYVECNALSSSPKEETLRAYLYGRRGIPFDLKDPAVPSYLMAVELAFPGSQAYFFHPLFNLLIGPIRLETSKQLERLKVPKIAIDVYRKRGELEMVDACDAYNEKLNAQQRAKRTVAAPPITLKWVQSLMYSIEPPVRSLLFTHGGLGVNRRRYGPVGEEIAALVEINSFDALAGAFGLFLEGHEIDDLTKMIAAREGVYRLLEAMQGSPIVKKIMPAISEALLARLQDTSVRGVNLLDAMRVQYPQTWGASYHLLRCSAGPDTERS